jgi:PEP-CTERM motif
MSLTSLRPFAASALLALAASAPQAAVLYSQTPVAGINGIQADGSTGPWSQSFTVAAGATLESIDWYGYHLFDGEISPGILVGPAFDLFSVSVNGIDVSTGASLGAPSFQYAATGLDALGNQVTLALYKYSLDIVDIAVASGTLDLANGPDTQWAWQFGGAGEPLTAFTLNGSVNAIPEPQTYALMALGLAAVAGAARRRRA